MTRFAMICGLVLLTARVDAVEKADPQKSDQHKVHGPRIVVEPDSFDFGRVLQDKTLTKTFQVKNVGDEDLVLDKPTTTCGCTAALVEDTVVTPGAAVPLRIELQTRSVLGFVERRVYLPTNDPAQQRFQIVVSATVIGTPPSAPPGK